MTSLSNAREIEHLRTARTAAADRFARQMKLLGQLEATAGDLTAVTGRWHSQLAALAKLAGSTQAAAELAGLAKPDVELAVKTSTPDAVEAAIDAATPPGKRTRPPAGRTTGAPTNAAGSSG